jgi:hypothetical protein
MRRKPYYFLTALLCVLCTQTALAQRDAFKKNLNTEWRFAAFSELGTSSPVDLQYYDPDTDSYKVGKDNFFFTTFIGFTYEPRFNVINFEDRASISVGLPLTGRVLIDISENTGDLPLITGSVGIYGDFNMGHKSTFNNIAGNGYALGLGVDIERFFTGEVESMMISPMARFKVISLINSVYDYYFAVLIKAGIPTSFDAFDGTTKVGNQNFGVQLIFNL